MGKFPLLAGEVLDEIRPGPVVLAYVVVVDRLVNETARGDGRVDGRGCGVGEAEQRLPIDLADNSTVDFYPRLGPDHLQVEHEPAGRDSR